MTVVYTGPFMDVLNRVIEEFEKNAGIPWEVGRDRMGVRAAPEKAYHNKPFLAGLYPEGMVVQEVEYPPVGPRDGGPPIKGTLVNLGDMEYRVLWGLKGDSAK